jgi:DNA-binding transcriptional LysR family regulator
MDVTNKSKVIKSLKNNEVDFALVSIIPNDIQVESQILMQNKLFLVGNKKTAVNQKIKIDNLLSEIPLIYREDGSATRISMEKFMTDKGIKAKMKLQLTSNEAVKQAIIAGLGLSIMPLIGLKNELEKEDIRILPVKGLPIITNWRLIWLKGKKLSPIASAYLQFVTNEKERINVENFSWINSY